MRQYLLTVVAAVAAFASVAHAADLHVCKLSADKKSVTVLVSNPYAQETHCTVNCHLILPGEGIHSESISCGKTVPAGAKEFELCTRTRQTGAYVRVDSDSNSECIKPLAQEKEDDEDDEKLADEMQKKSQEMLRSLQKK
ncbi:hypothetical protein MXD81_63485 [Microbacteriaceae bacterium K1510]|nr:hypothetical protein [Microbacteriaceae bacterium K1510]